MKQYADWRDHFLQEVEMHRTRISFVLATMVVLVACSNTEDEPKTASSGPKGTQIVTLDPWAGEQLSTKPGVVSLTASETNWCDPSRVSERSDAYMCIFDAPGMVHFPDALCFRNPAAADTFACLEQDLSWQVLRGLNLRGIGSTKSPGVQGRPVYLELTDGTICTASSKSAMPSAGEYPFLGVCDDDTFFFAHVVYPFPTDDSNPFADGTDNEGRWLIRTDSKTSDQLAVRAVETAYR
ncbi:hypothetical protein ACP3TD_09525 [Pseudarthrobacter sp. 1G09]|uniref:hypothetical protein n=1 Tax=Pseudarthrobacter sp. 1G09 TaxID=3416178 RepID=UPI003CF832DA